MSQGKVTAFLTTHLLFSKFAVQERAPKCFDLHQFKEKNVHIKM